MGPKCQEQMHQQKEKVNQTKKAGEKLIGLSAELPAEHPGLTDALCNALIGYF